MGNSGSVTIAIFALNMVLLSGCAFIGGFDAPKVEHRFERAQPLLVSKAQIQKVKVLVISPPLDKSTKDVEVLYVTESLGKSGRFKIVSPATFQREAAKEGANLSLMTMEDRVALAQRVGKSLGADAVGFLTAEEVAVGLGGQILIGKGSVEGKNRLRIYSVESGTLLWEQIQQVGISMGAFRGPGAQDHLIRAQYDPLMVNLLESFRE